MSDPYRLEPAMEERIKKFIVKDARFKYGDNRVHLIEDFSNVTQKIKDRFSFVLWVRFSEPSFAKAKKILKEQFPGIAIEKTSADSYIIYRDVSERVGSGELAHPEVKKSLSKAASEPGQTRITGERRPWKTVTSAKDLPTKPVTIKEVKEWVVKLKIGVAKDVTAKTKEAWLKKILERLEKVTGEKGEIIKRATVDVNEELGYSFGKEFVVVERQAKKRRIDVPYAEPSEDIASRVVIEAQRPEWTPGVGWTYPKAAIARAKAMIDRIKYTLRR